VGQARLIIGLMSGTSVDAIDAALVRVDRRGERYAAEVLFHRAHPWPTRLRQRLLAAMAPALVRTGEICELNFLVAREFARSAKALLARAEVTREKVDAIGSHGQTICHLPMRVRGDGSRRTLIGKGALMAERAMGSTLQIGDVSVIATLTGIVTVGDFRAADMAVGGQGAPLVPWADDMLLSHATKVRCVQNIGGIANVTYLPALRKVSQAWTFYTPGAVTHKKIQARESVLAFDTGPGNMVMDAVVSLGTNGRMRYDRGGKLAARGVLDQKLFRALQGHAYFERRPPKSTGREEFGMAFARKLLAGAGGRVKLETLVHTLARLTAWSIGEGYRKFLPRMPEEVIVCGGGAENPMLMGMLGEELGGVKLRRIDEFGIPNKAKEAASFALLAAATLDGLAGNIPTVTGAGRGVVLGVVAKPGKIARK